MGLGTTLKDTFRGVTLVHGVTKKWPKIPRKFIPRCGQPSADKLQTEGRGGQKWHKIAYILKYRLLMESLGAGASTEGLNARKCEFIKK